MSCLDLSVLYGSVCPYVSGSRLLSPLKQEALCAHTGCTHTHSTPGLAHLHAWPTDLSVGLRREFRVQIPASRGQIPRGPSRPMNASESDGRPPPHFPRPAQGLRSPAAQTDDASAPCLPRTASAEAPAVATPPPSGPRWERGVGPAPAVRPCRHRCPLAAQCLEAANEDSPWHPEALTVRLPCFSRVDGG